MVDRRPAGGPENQLESLRGSCKKALFLRFAFLWGRAFYCIGQWLSCVAGRTFMYAAAGRGSRRRGVCGTMRASSPTGVCYSAEVAVSRLAAGSPLVRRGGIYPSRGCLRRRRVRRDEGIPPYGRFISFAYTGKAACFRREERHVGADSISALGVCGGAGLPGTMRASSPTGVCYSAEVAVSRSAAGPPLVRRGGIYPSRGRSRRRGPGRYGIGPYRGLFYRRVCAFPVGRGPRLNSKNSEL